MGVCAVVAWQPSSAGEASETPSERLTRPGSMMPLREPPPQEFALEADNAPYTVIDPTVSEHESQVHDTQIFVFNGKLGIAYSDGIPNRQVKLWYDDGSGGGTAGDARDNGSEVRGVNSVDLREAPQERSDERYEGATVRAPFTPTQVRTWRVHRSRGRA